MSTKNSHVRQSNLGLRQSNAVCMADGGLLRRMVNAVMPGTRKVNEPANVSRINNAIEQQTGPAPAPVPVAAAPEPEPKPFRFAHGGKVSGPGTATSDSIPARLSDGEFVFPTDSVEAIGAHNLEAMRQATHTPVRHGLRSGVRHFADGGLAFDPDSIRNPNYTAGTSPEASAYKATQAAQAGPMPPNASQVAANEAGAANSLRSATTAGKITSLARSAAGVAKNALGPGAAAAAGIMAAGQGLRTGTEDYAARMGEQAGDGILKDTAIRTAGVLGDLGNILTFNTADRLGNAMAGNGFVRSNTRAPAPAPTSPVLSAPQVNMGKTVAPTPVITADSSPALTENQRFQAEANKAGLRAGDLAAGQTYATNIGRRNQELDADRIANQKAFEDKAAAATAQAKSVDEFNRNVRSSGPGLAGGMLRDPHADAINAAIASGSAPALQAAVAMKEAEDRNATALQQSQIQADAGLRGHAMSADASKYAADTSLAGHQMSSQVARMQGAREQFNKDREYQRATNNDTVKNSGEVQSQIGKQLEAMHTSTVDGKPVVDSGAVSRIQGNIEKALGDFGAKGYQDLSMPDRTRLVAASTLLDKMQNYGTNYPIPWRPDLLKTTNAADLVNMRRLPNGDAQITRKGSPAFGQVIPARVLNKVNNDWFGGQPTSDFNTLFRSEEK